MSPGDSVFIKATVLRVTGNRLDAQTANGQLIQTEVSNVMTEEKKRAATEKPEKAEPPKRNEQKSVGLSEHKAELRAPENKSSKK